MFSFTLSCPRSHAEFVASELWDFSPLAISEEDHGEITVLRAGFATTEHRLELLMHFDSHQPCWESDDNDWDAETRRAWPPRNIGDRLFLAAVWCTDPTPPGRIRLIHNPGMASGTGEHPCTQLALEALETLVTSGTCLVDVGTGSGILSIGALHLGAVAAIAIDSDTECLATAHANMLLNALQPMLIAGSADCLRDGYADIVVANISGTVLLAILDDLLRIAKSAGGLVLTGFTEGEMPVFQSLFPAAIVTARQEWRCLAIRLS